MRIVRVGVILGGNFLGGNFAGGDFPSGSYPEQEYSMCVFCGWELFWVGIFLDGNFPGANFPMGIIQVAILRRSFPSTLYNNNLSHFVIADTLCYNNLSHFVMKLLCCTLQYKIYQKSLRNSVVTLCDKRIISSKFPAFLPTQIDRLL